VVVNPVGRAAVVMLSRDMSANPNTNIRHHIDITRLRIRFVLEDRRRPVNGHAAKGETQKNGHVQPVTPAYQEVVFTDYRHAGFFQFAPERNRRALSSWGVERGAH
jgi:hypothetical protein